MTTQTNRDVSVLSRKRKALAAGLLAVGMMAAFSLMPTLPAHAATTFTVNSTADAPDAFTTSNTCDTDVFTNGDQCTLRAAIQQANATAGADAISFAIPGTGVKTIAVGATGLGALPPITEQVNIDGYTQPGASPNTKAVGNNAALKVVLDGTNAGTATGLTLSDASESVIKGLVINRFGLTGITVFGASVGNRIEGNFIGTDKSGTKDLGNTTNGVEIIGGSNNTLGGTTAASRNVVSGNGGNGVSIFNGSGNSMLGNRIGTTAGGTGALGNTANGVAISASENFIGDGTTGGANTIAFNGRDGVEIEGVVSIGNRISRNSIFSNTGLGIDLEDDGPTANDPGDTDSGPNGLQNKPVLTAAKTGSGKTTIKGTLNSGREVGYLLQFFSNPSGDEGKKFIGEKIVSTDSSGNASFTFTPATAVPAGQTVTATAAGDRNAPDGTSEFSTPKKVTSS